LFQPLASTAGQEDTHIGGAVGTGLEFGILGPLEVRRGGTLVPVGGPRQRALLGLLLCHANRVVSRDQLIDELLAGQPAGQAERMLRVQVSRLRQVLADSDGEPRVVARPPGYLLRVQDGELDLQVFEQRVAAGRQALQQGDPGHAAAMLGAAESLWRGRPLADLEFEPFARFEIQRLQELRLLAAEDRIDAELGLGHHTAVCPELGRLVAEHPLRERLRGQLMLALYRSGRQGEALETYRAGRSLLITELAVEPSPALRHLQDQVLAADPGLDLPAPAGAAATQALPRDIASFTGRERELAHLLGAIDGRAADGAVVGIHAIDGMAGIGKTTFAVHAARRLAPGFPDGQFFLPLHAHTAGHRPVDPADGLASLLLAAEVPASQIPPGLEARAARWRAHVAGKKVLLLLDDAAGHEQVRPLLPGTAGSLVLITSRRRLAALDDAAVISLDVLPAAEAAALFARLAARPGLVAGDAAVGEITRLCGYLPLAIGMIAGQLRHHPVRTVGQLATELAASRDRLAMMYAENLSVAAAFGLSYADLTQGQQRLFRRLGLIPGPSFDAYAAAALDGIGLGAARRDLDELYDQHLITEPVPGRYRLHDLLRQHARTLAAADDPAARDAAMDRLLDYYLHTALAAYERAPTRATEHHRPPPGYPPAHAPDLATHQQAAGWLETERPNLHAAADHAAATGRRVYAFWIPDAMSDLLIVAGRWDQAATLQRTALTAARQARDRTGQAYAVSQLGVVQSLTGDYPAAAASYQQAIALYREAGYQRGVAYVLTTLGTLWGLTGDYPAAAASHRQALAIAQDLGDRLRQAYALHELGVVQRLTGDYTAAAASLKQVLALCGDGDLAHRAGQAWALHELGVVQQETGNYPAAAVSLQQALALFGDLGHRVGQAWALRDLGVVQQQTGDYPAATAALQQALKLFCDFGSRLGEARTLTSLGDLSSRTAGTQQARDHYARALAIARDIGLPLEEASALEGLGRTDLQEGTTQQGATRLRQALAIYQRIGAPTVQRVQETPQHGLTSTTTEPAAPSSEGNQSRAPSHPKKPSRDRSSAGNAAEQPDLRGHPSAGTKQRGRA
jgi:DNA-binding SARP family transcriptional activator/tetratricopeptide (TPR) repeat protein